MGHIELTRVYEMNQTKTKVVYTAVFGDYDVVSAVNPQWGCDFICFTDNPKLVSDGWQVVTVRLNDETPSQANRRYKMLPHLYLPSYERSLYIDGNIKLVIDPSPLFEKYLDKGLIAIPTHQDRNCVYTEAQYCIKGGRVDKEITEQQMANYAAKGFPVKFGMTENGVIFRKHLHENVIKLMDAWWVEYNNGGKRDQLSLPYLIWAHKINVLEVTEGLRINTMYFLIDLHAKDQTKNLISRLARQVNERKHLTYHYLIISKVVSLIVAIRDKILIGNRNT